MMGADGNTGFSSGQDLSMALAAPSGAVMVYDGACPFCTQYVRYMKFKQAVGPVVLKDAREGGAIVDGLVAKGFDLDEGMVLIYGRQIYHGADCIHMIALLSSRSSIVNRVNAALFRHPRIARRIYPVLRGCRNAVLRLLGRSKLSG